MNILSNKPCRVVKGPFFLSLCFGNRAQEAFLDKLVFGGAPEILEQFTDEQLIEIGLNKFEELVRDHLTFASVDTCLESGDLWLGENFFWLKSRSRLRPNHIFSPGEFTLEPQHYRSEE